MAKARRSNDWGFPRWRGYGSSREATTVRLCDRHGCEEPGDCPAPKSPNNLERWYFCQKHAAEYNSKWDYFEGLEKAEAARRKGEALSIGLVGNCAEVLPELVRRGFHPDVVTDQTFYDMRACGVIIIRAIGCPGSHKT